MRRRVRSSQIIGVLLLVLGASAAQAQGGDVKSFPAEDDYRRLNAALVETYVIPRYEVLAAATDSFDGAVKRFCAQPEPSGTDRLRTGFHGAADAWMAVQHIAFGPVELFMRSYRIYFWPQASGKVGPALDELLVAQDRAALTPDRFPQASVAAQGMLAAERLIFAAPDELVGGKDADFRCALLGATAGNLAQMAHGIVEDWRGGKISYADAVATPGQDNSYYQTHKDATLALFKSFHGGLEVIADRRLKPVIGASAGSARPNMAEARPSRRSMRNIVVQLRALEAMYLGDGGMGFSGIVREQKADAELDALMRRAFRLTRETAESIGRPLDEAATEASIRPQVEKLKTQVLALKQIVRTRVAEALGLSVGFNALDGD